MKKKLTERVNQERKPNEVEVARRKNKEIVPRVNYVVLGLTAPSFILR